MASSRLLQLIHEVAEEGCLFLLLTGGEPLLHPDFEPAYRYAKAKGLLTTVFTNGTTITERHLDLFSELPPLLLEVTIYGASRATYKAVTGSAEAFDRLMATIPKLLSRGVHLKLKTMLTTLNLHELDVMQSMARQLGVSFRFDAAVHPTLEGEKEPLSFRIAAREAVLTEFASEERREAWTHYAARSAPSPQDDALYDCGAGLNSFHVTADGYLQPCLMVADIRYDLHSGDFRSGWAVMQRISERKMPPELACAHCDVRAFCNYCPSAFALESSGVPRYYCEVSRARAEFVQRSGERKNYESREAVV